VVAAGPNCSFCDCLHFLQPCVSASACLGLHRDVVILSSTGVGRSGLRWKLEGCGELGELEGKGYDASFSRSDGRLYLTMDH
jgi:hypothetical protein